MNKRTEFKLRFENEAGEDFAMILRTYELKTEEEIREMILNHSGLYDSRSEEFSPLDIMDDICDENGWDWEDLDYQEMVFTTKEWFERGWRLERSES